MRLRRAPVEPPFPPLPPIPARAWKDARPVDSGRDSHRDPPQVVVLELLLEVDAVTVASGGWTLSSPAHTPLAGTQLHPLESQVHPGYTFANTSQLRGDPKVTTNGAAEPDSLGKDRSPASVLGLSIITLGIYYLVWYHHINAEIRRHDPDIKVTPGWAVVASLVPLANIISGYSTAARIRQMQLDDGQTNTISPVVALLLMLFLGIGYPLYVASQIREHWHGHRRALRTSAA